MKQVVLKIGGMSCSACSNSLEKFLKKQEGIFDANVNLVMASAAISYDEKISLKELESMVNKSGFKSLGLFKIEDESKDQKRFTILLVFATLSLFLLYVTMGHMVGLPMFSFFNSHSHPLNFGILCLILVIPYLIYGFDIFKAGIKNIFYLSPNMDTLVTIGVFASFIYSFVNLILIASKISDNANGLYFESSAIIIFFVKLGRFVDYKIKNKTKNAIKELVQITPDKAKKKTDDGYIDITIDLVQVNDLLVASTGDKVAVDGIVEDGLCYIDQSFLTGESRPVKKQKGDKLVAGSIILSGSIIYSAKKIGKDSTISEIVRLVVDATNTKTQISRIADKVSSIFVPTIILIALISFTCYLIITKDFSRSINVFVSLLVVACPCALGLATPLAIVISVGILAKNGIIIKNSQVLELSNKVNTIIFDKTGTLTYGKLSISQKFTYVDDLSDYIAAIEARSNHPIASAFSKFHKKYSVTDYQTFEGMGICGTIDNNKIYLGNRKLVEHLGIINNHIEDENLLKQNGNTIIYAIMNSQIYELYGIKDVIRDSSKSLITKLKQIGITPVMLTGDNDEVAKITAQEIRNEKYYSNIMPSEKLNYIKDYQNNNQVVMMVGDGINDAPSIAAANVGVSIKGATSIAADAADAIIMSDNLSDLLDLINISKKTIINIKENLFWAFLYNSLMIPIAIGVLLPFGISLNPMIAGMGMTLSSISVLLNTLHLLKFKKKKGV